MYHRNHLYKYYNFVTLPASSLKWLPKGIKDFHYAVDYNMAIMQQPKVYVEAKYKYQSERSNDIHHWIT